MEQLKIFMSENPDIMKVSTSKNKNLLLWAEEKRYITLKEFEGEKYFFKAQLDQAVMWESKLGITIAEDA